MGEQRVALRPDLRLRWGAGARYAGAFDEAVVFNQALETVRTPSFTLVDGLLALEGKRWTLAVNATNLFDRRYYAGCSVRSACGVGYRRNLISTLTYRF